MKFSAQCPACANEFEIAGIAAAKSGLTCPKCAVGFVPEKIHRSEEMVEPKPTPPPRNWEAMQFENRVEKIRRNAHLFSFIGGIFAALGILALIVGIANANGGGTFAIFAFSSAATGIGLWFYLVAQIIHIRANTEK